jgi:hypothetical protein
MQRIFKNQYKRHDIFSCNHSSHFRFGGAVSTYYILSEKKCYPEGCINFIWKCRLLNKGHACPKKFTHVGRKCFSCKHYYEEKYCQQPKLKVDREDYEKFLRDKDDFDHWLGQNENRQVEIEAVISGIKPNLITNGPHKGSRLRFNGWILVFDNVYVDYDLFDDTAFAWISERAQERCQFTDGTRFEARAKFNFERGRLIFNRLHGIEIKKTGDGIPPDLNKIMVAAETASRIPVQPEKCLRCPEGVLIDKAEERRNNSGRKRQLICLRGVKNPSECIYHLTPLLENGD